MLPCPHCRIVQKKKLFRERILWQCPKCKGHTVPYALLEKVKEGAETLAFLRQKPKNPKPSKLRCPVCFRRFRLVLSGGGVTELDTCDSCKLAWFEVGEVALEEGQVPRFRKEAPSLPAPVEETPPLPLGLTTEWPSHENLIHFITLLPKEEEEPPLRTKVWVTYLMISFCVLVTLAGGWDHRLQSSLAFIPTEAFRGLGLTFFSSLFVHAGALHLLGNCYFIWLFGDNVEDILGPGKFSELFLLSGLGGTICYLFFHAHQSVPVIGASGAVMGLATFYAAQFPRAKISHFLPLVFFIFRLRLNTWLIILLYVLLDAYGLPSELRGGKIAHVSHLGGAAVGLLYWAFWKRL